MTAANFNHAANGTLYNNFDKKSGQDIHTQFNDSEDNNFDREEDELKSPEYLLSRAKN